MYLGELLHRSHLLQHPGLGVSRYGKTRIVQIGETSIIVKMDVPGGYRMSDHVVRLSSPQHRSQLSYHFQDDTCSSPQTPDIVFLNAKYVGKIVIRRAQAGPLSLPGLVVERPGFPIGIADVHTLLTVVNTSSQPESPPPAQVGTAVAAD